MKHFYLEMAFEQITVGFMCVCLVYFYFFFIHEPVINCLS